MDENGNRIGINEIYKGTAIKIYKKEILLKTIDFVELNIDTSVLEKEYNIFYWETTKEQLVNYPVLLKNNILKIATIDNQILNFNITTGAQLKPENLDSEMLRNFVRYAPKRKSKVQRKGFTDEFVLPKLSDGRTIETGLSEYLNLQPSESNSDSALVMIYFRTLLINKDGKCEQCFVTPTIRKTTKVEFRYDTDQELKKKIEDWIYKEGFDIKLIPKYNDKYGFRSIIYLK